MIIHITYTNRHRYKASTSCLICGYHPLPLPIALSLVSLISFTIAKPIYFQYPFLPFFLSVIIPSFFPTSTFITAHVDFLPKRSDELHTIFPSTLTWRVFCQRKEECLSGVCPIKTSALVSRSSIMHMSF